LYSIAKLSDFHCKPLRQKEEITLLFLSCLFQNKSVSKFFIT